MKKAVSIEIKWNDGSISKAEGYAATAIMEWYGACETLNCIHGAQYRGPDFTVIPAGCMDLETAPASNAPDSAGGENSGPDSQHIGSGGHE